MDIELVPLAGDASTRRYFRVVSADQSWVLMSWDPFQDDEHYPFLSVLRHFQRSDVHVPSVISLAPELGQVLLEDLGDLTLERKFWENNDPSAAQAFYQMALDELVKIHVLATRDREPCTAFSIEFNVEKLLWEMNYGRDHLLRKLCGLRLSESVEKQITQVFEDVCRRLADEPKVICHRDYHSRNLMLKLNRMRVIDFQDARMGSIAYDLVSLLRDSYVNIPEPMADQLLNYYFQQCAAHGTQIPSQDSFREIYELQSIQRCFKACGTFAAMHNTRNDIRYLKYLSHTLARVAKSLALFPAYRPFLQCLQDEGVLSKSYDPKDIGSQTAQILER